MSNVCGEEGGGGGDILHFILHILHIYLHILYTAPLNHICNEQSIWGQVLYPPPLRLITIKFMLHM